MIVIIMMEDKSVYNGEEEVEKKIYDDTKIKT